MTRHSTPCTVGPIDHGLSEAVVGRDVARSGQLGHSVNLFHVAAGTARTCGDEVAGHRRGADRHHVQAREVVVVEQVSVGQRLDDRGNDLGACHVVALDRGEEPLDLEPGHQHHARAGPQGQVERDLEPERVHERQRGEHGVAARHTMGVAHLTQAGDEVAMGQHDALGQPAGAAGTREKRRVGGTGQPGREAALPRGDDLLECRSSGRIAVDDERPSDRGTERRIAQDALEQVRCRDNPARIRREEVIGELAGLRMRADRCDGRTDGQCGVPRDDEVDAVRRAQRHDIARAYARRSQAMSGSTDLVDKFGVRQGLARGGVDERATPAVLGRLAQHVLRKCLVRDHGLSGHIPTAHDADARSDSKFATRNARSTDWRPLRRGSHLVA